MWDDIYNVSDYVYGREANDFLKASANHLPKGDVLCLADGEGRNSVFLAKQGYNVTAVDLSNVAIEKARQLAAEQNVNINFVHANLNDFDFGSEQWDGIVSIFCHLPETLRRSVHQRITDGLKPSGVYLAEGYTPKQLEFKTGGPSMAEMMYSEALIKEELAGLNFLHLEEKERFICEGNKHNGASHVVQVVARKG